MRITVPLQKALAFLLTCSVFLAFSAGGSSESQYSPQELARGYFWYEAIFLDNEEVKEIFREVSDQYPQNEYIPGNFHVTTQYMPEPRHEELYGTPVTIHIIGYTSGSVQDPQENITSENEGFLVELSAEDEKMQALIDSCDKIWHITGSYSTDAKYTGQLDFSGMTPIDITIHGVFGMEDSNGTVIHTPSSSSQASSSSSSKMNSSSSVTRSINLAPQYGQAI